MIQLALSGLIAGVFMLATCASQAAPLRGDRDSCHHFGTVVLHFGELRDQGAPWEVAQPYVIKMLEEGRGNPESYVQNEDDARFVAAGIHKLWLASAMPSFTIAAEVFNDCMKKSGKVSL